MHKLKRPKSAAKYCARYGKGGIMSRIGKKVINVPAKTKVEIKDNVITASGALGSLSYTVPAGITPAGISIIRIDLCSFLVLKWEEYLTGLLQALPVA